MDSRLPLYITSAGGWDNQELMEREDGFPDYQWIQTKEGIGQLDVGGKSYTLSRGQGMLLFPHEKHAYYPVKEPWEVQWVTFNGNHADKLLADLGFQGSQVLYLTHPDVTLRKMHAALSALQSNDPLRAIECSGWVYRIVLDLFQYASRSEVKSKQQHFEQLTPIFDFIERHYHEDITLQQLAGQLGISPQYTCLLFRETVGLRPFVYITRFRLSKAKELLLRQAALEIKEVAKQVGYEDPSYFIKLFKQQEGVTPSHFRRIHMGLDHLP
nr:AraC family transcriptional regulator [Paenibacillus hamazuiensis]